jgi:hypothetical protein
MGTNRQAIARSPLDDELEDTSFQLASGLVLYLKTETEIL